MSIKTEYTYTVVLEPEATGFVATCPALAGVVSEGDTFAEALESIRDAIRGYITSLINNGLDVPEERGATFSSVKVRLKTV